MILLNQNELAATLWKNRLQTLLLLAIMGLFVWLLGTALLGSLFAWYATLTVLLMLALNPALSPRMLMRAYAALPIENWQAPDLIHATQLLAERAGLPAAPQLYYLPIGTMNAFATGNPANSAIGLSDGLLRQLRQDEIIGVLAHEISHIRHQDIRIMTISDMMGQLTRLLSLFGQLLILLSLPVYLSGLAEFPLLAFLLIVFAPGFCALLQLALSRRREFQADAAAAQLMGTPRPLIRALDKLGRQNSYWERFYRASSDNALLRTHPETAERIAALSALEIKSLWEPLPQTALFMHQWLPVKQVPPRRVSRYFWF
jgi:heat shock protein HtpX